MPTVKGRKVASGGGNVKAAVKAGSGKKSTAKKGTAQAPGVWNPGIENETVQPFMTAEDIMAYAEAKQAYENELHELDFNYATSVANTGYEKEQLTKGAVKGKDDTNWDAAGRGLFRSSIRDADLFDIDATAEMRKTFLDTQLNTLRLNTEARKFSLDQMWNNPETGYMHGLALKKAGNAMAANQGIPKYKVEPHMEKPAATAAAKNKAQQARPFVNNGPIGARGSTGNGGTTFRPGSKPPARPKTNVGGQRKVMGRLA